MFKFSAQESEDYGNKGYAHLKGLISDAVGQRILATVKSDLLKDKVDLSGKEFPDVLDRATVDIYGPRFAPFKFLLWGLTPLFSTIAGKDLAPTYSFFRIYRNGDVLRFHTDRPACDHSMTLTLAYSDDRAWPFEVMNRGVTFEDMLQGGQEVEPFEMNAGDAIIYRGIEVPHGRLSPNPNGWSAHLFLHWVDLDGPHGDHAFDREEQAGRVDFEIA